MATISTHNGSSVSQQHNLRNRKVTDKEEHIDRNGEHETWVHETEIHAYHRLFDKAQEEYNAKQTRADRQINNYHQKVKDDVKQHTCYEMIIGVYGGENEQTCKEIMKEFVDTWKERNPNLELIGAYYHNDEMGEGHCHIDYIPVAHGYSRGMETQAGLVKAFEEMGYEKQGKLTAQIQWEANQNKYLEELCISRGIEVEHPKEQDRHHLETELYKAQQQAKDLAMQLSEKDMELEKANEQLEKVLELKARASEIKKPMFHKTGDCKGTVTYNENMLDSTREIGRKAREELEKAQGKERALITKEKDIKAHEEAIEPLYKKALETLEKAEEYKKEEERYIYGTAENIANEKFEQFKKDFGRTDSRSDRLEDFCKDIKFKDGKSVLDKFEEEEQELERRMEYSWGIGR